MKKIVAAMFMSVLLISCGSTDKDKETSVKHRYMPESYGKPNSMTVIADTELWKGAVGDSIRSILGAPVDGLPMEEPLFTMLQVKPSAFEGILEKCRNLLILSPSKNGSFKIKDNVYARPQKILYISGTNQQIIEQLSANSKKIISIIKENELFARQHNLEASNRNNKPLEKAFGISLKMPIAFNLKKEAPNFLWFDKRVPKGTSNIIVYTLPYGSIPHNDNTIDAIIAMRDSIGKKHIPGRNPKTMHMVTEKGYAPYLQEAIIDNKKALESKGIWEMKNFPMAGPFINYIIDDKIHNRLLVIEGFTYAPFEEKRDFMFELEAILKTLKIKV